MEGEECFRKGREERGERRLENMEMTIFPTFSILLLGATGKKEICLQVRKTFLRLGRERSHRYNIGAGERMESFNLSPLPFPLSSR